MCQFYIREFVLEQKNKADTRERTRNIMSTAVENILHGRDQIQIKKIRERQGPSTTVEINI